MPFLANHFYCPIHVAFHPTATGFYTAYGGVCAIEPKQSIFGCAALGLTCAILPFEQRGFGGVIQVIAGRVGKMLGGGLVLLIYHHYGWQSAVDLISVFALLLILQISLYSEPTVAAESQNPPLRFFIHAFFFTFGDNRTFRSAG